MLFSDWSFACVPQKHNRHVKYDFDLLFTTNLLGPKRMSSIHVVCSKMEFEPYCFFCNNKNITRTMFIVLPFREKLLWEFTRATWMNVGGARWPPTRRQRLQPWPLIPPVGCHRPHLPSIYRAIANWDRRRNEPLLVWRSGNGVCRINEVKLRRARLVLGLVTTFGGYISRLLMPTQPGHPSASRCNEYRRWFRPSLVRNGTSEVTTL